MEYPIWGWKQEEKRHTTHKLNNKKPMVGVNTCPPSSASRPRIDNECTDYFAVMECTSFCNSDLKVWQYREGNFYDSYCYVIILLKKIILNWILDSKIDIQMQE